MRRLLLLLSLVAAGCLDPALASPRPFSVESKSNPSGFATITGPLFTEDALQLSTDGVDEFVDCTGIWEEVFGEAAATKLTVIHWYSSKPQPNDRTLDVAYAGSSASGAGAGGGIEFITLGADRIAPYLNSSAATLPTYQWWSATSNTQALTFDGTQGVDTDRADNWHRLDAETVFTHKVQTDYSIAASVDFSTTGSNTGYTFVIPGQTGGGSVSDLPAYKIGSLAIWVGETLTLAQLNEAILADKPTDLNAHSVGPPEFWLRMGDGGDAAPATTLTNFGSAGGTCSGVNLEAGDFISW